MMNKFIIWGAIFLMLAIIVLPTTYLIFSFWWLLTGDMVTRLTFFTTGLISNTAILINRKFTPQINANKKMNIYQMYNKDTNCNLNNKYRKLVEECEKSAEKK